MKQDRGDENDPFERLVHTHRRIEERLDELEQAADDVRDDRLRASALGVIRDVLGFFDRAARRHHDDEEETLFPRLASVAALASLIGELQAEHRAHDEALEALRGLVAEWGDAGPDAASEARLPGVVATLATIYRTHIRREEKELFPAARTALPATVIAEMGMEMQSRRGSGGGHRR